MDEDDASDFEMVIRDVFAIEGRGTIVVGDVLKGSLRSGATAVLLSQSGPLAVPRISVEISRRVKPLRAGITPPLSVLVEGVEARRVASGDRLVSPRQAKVP